MHTFIYPVVSYSLSEVALSLEKTANGTLSQAGGRAAPGMVCNDNQLSLAHGKAPVSPDLAKGFGGYEEPW